MRLLHNTIRKLQERLAWLGWWLWLKRRVTGRVKLRGNLHGLSISPSFRCDGDLWLGIYSDDGQIHIAPDVHASGPLVITAINRVTLGTGVLIGPNVIVTDHYHGDPKKMETFDVPPSMRPLITRGPIEIDDYVQLGANTSILSPTRIGQATILGANSVAIGNLEPRAVYAGLPARPITVSSPRSHENE